MGEALSMEMRSGCHEKLFYYAYDLALAIESQEGKFGKKHRILKGWREDENDNYLWKYRKVTEKGKFPCVICRKAVGSNSILC